MEVLGVDFEEGHGGWRRGEPKCVGIDDFAITEDVCGPYDGWEAIGCGCYIQFGCIQRCYGLGGQKPCLETCFEVVLNQLIKFRVLDWVNDLVDVIDPIDLGDFYLILFFYFPLDSCRYGVGVSRPEHFDWDIGLVFDLSWLGPGDGYVYEIEEVAV